MNHDEKNRYYLSQQYRLKKVTESKSVKIDLEIFHVHRRDSFFYDTHPIAIFFNKDYAERFINSENERVNKQ